MHVSARHSTPTSADAIIPAAEHPIVAFNRGGRRCMEPDEAALYFRRLDGQRELGQERHGGRLAR